MSTSSQPNPLTADAAFSPAPPPRSTAQIIFLGPNGLRAGWRILIFFCLIAAVGSGINFVLHRIPSWVEWNKVQAAAPESEPPYMLVTEGLDLFLLFVCAFIMSLIEKRSFADYYLPPNQAFGKRFWQGVPYGFMMLTLLMAIIGALHGMSMPTVALGGSTALKYALLWGIGFLLVGFFEEFSFRGYFQSTLGSGIGFWPSALILSLLFGAIHLGNKGEAAFGAIMAGSFGLLAAFSLSRTGNIWFPIGMHAAWDWGETYFYGVADSGLIAKGHLLNSSFHGPNWLTGGTVGPEGSVFALVVLAIGAVGIHFLFPTKQVSG
jgi:membrane protease YdiL (CAAX protease family)